MNTEPSETSTNSVHTSEATALPSTRKYKPMPSDSEIEKARKSMTRSRFTDWLAKRTAAAQADQSTAVEPYPIFDRTERRIADRVAPQESGIPRCYKGDPKRTEPYGIGRVSSASETKGPADYRKREASEDGDDGVVITMPYLGSPGPVADSAKD